MWSKDISAHVKPLPDLGTDRMCIVEFTNGKFRCYIMSVYLPYAGCQIADLRNELNELELVLAECSKNGEILIIGDMNSHFSCNDFPRGWGKTSTNGRILNTFTKQWSLNIVDLIKGSGPCVTFSNSRGMKSYVDHCIISDGLMGLVKSCSVIPDSVLNISDHCAISIELNCYYIPIKNMVTHPKVGWSKASADMIAETYTWPLEQHIIHLLTEYDINPLDVLHGGCEKFILDEADINIFIQRMTVYIHVSTSKLPKISFCKSKKPYWDKELTQLNNVKKQARRECAPISVPDVNDNSCRVSYKDAKRKFRSALRLKQYEYEKHEMDEICMNQEINQKYFWYLVSKHKRSGKRVTPIRSDAGVMLTDPHEIRSEWNKYYERLYKCQDDDLKYDNEFKNMVETELNSIIEGINYTGTLKGGPINVEELKKQITRLKNNKAAGWDHVTAEHIKYAGDICISTLAWIMNCMVKSKSIPQHLKRGLIVPIPKPGKDCSIKDKNRGITLLPVVYKLFEMVILQREKKWLFDNKLIEDLQGAAQENCSSLHVSMVLQEAINHNLNKGESVYVAFLDIQKAFDTVWIPGLLYKLAKAGIDPVLLLIIKESFNNFQCSVQIAGEVSRWFLPERGLHQGAPISMTLYQLYINELLQMLKSCGYGFQINDINVGCPTFADDISIGTITKYGLNHMLNIANRYKIKWRYDFSLEKCLYMVWGEDKMPHIPVQFGDNVLRKVDSCKHMGVTLSSHNTKKGIISERIGKARQSLFAARGIGSYSVPVTPMVLSKI